MSKGRIIGQASAEQIAQWKDKYGDIFAFKVEDTDDTTHICYLRTPNRKDLSAATFAGKDSPIKFNEVILRQCWLDGGSLAIRENDRMFLAVSGKIAEIIEIGEAELEKL